MRKSLWIVFGLFLAGGLLFQEELTQLIQLFSQAETIGKIVLTLTLSSVVPIALWMRSHIKSKACQQCPNVFEIPKEANLIEVRPMSVPGCFGSKGCVLVEQHRHEAELVDK